ncbi:signal peptidase I [Microbacterium sp. NPDC089698]|uniref:signal peptidase I n=1 Tax=Microbacterium sp. NPDC089698 TaxID=3364200 RepID=UPI00381E9041
MTQATTPAPLTRRAQRESGTPAPRRRPTARGVLSEVLLWVAALAGLVCIVLVVLAFTAHITLIMFRTGSMSPTIPAGSVAIVQQIPASQVHVGDVVTVDRPGQLPVTHRVRAVEDGTAPAERLITLRGDANAQDDPAPYPVSTVRIVRLAIPGLAPVIVAFGNPFVLGGLTLGATALVIWAFWPRTGGRARKAGTATEGDPGS